MMFFLSGLIDSHILFSLFLLCVLICSCFLFRQEPDAFQKETQIIPNSTQTTLPMFVRNVYLCMIPIIPLKLSMLCRGLEKSFKGLEELFNGPKTMSQRTMLKAVSRALSKALCKALRGPLSYTRNKTRTNSTHAKQPQQQAQGTKTHLGIE